MQRLRRLAARRAVRWDEGRFVAEGPKLVAEALEAGAQLETVFVERDAASPVVVALVERAAAAGAEVVDVGAGVLARVADSVTPQPVVAVAAMVHVPLAALPASGLLVVCAGLADPGNAGTVLRSAAASGATAVVMCSGGVDLYNPKTVRASAGALFRLPVVAGASPEAALTEIRSRGFTRLAALARGGRDHDRVDWTRPTAVVVGSESHGLPGPLAAATEGSVTVPMHASVESLNAAMAATVICFEAARQRRAATIGAA